MSLKTTRIIYWIITLLLFLLLVFLAFSAWSQQSTENMAHVGLSDATRLQYIIAYAPAVGIVTIVIPQISNRLKERAYAGLSFVYLGAFIAHIFIDGLANPATYPSLVVFALVMISYAMWHKILKPTGENL